MSVLSPPFITGLFLVVAVVLAIVVFFLHQISLLLFVTALGEHLPLPSIRRLRRATTLAIGLALLTLVDMLGLLYLVGARMLGRIPASALQGAIFWLLLLALPLLALPCYMLSAEIAAGWRADIENRYSSWLVAVAVVLRRFSGLCYIVFVLVSFALAYSIRWSASLERWNMPLAVLTTLILFGYLCFAPVPVLFLLSVLGQIQRIIARRQRVLPQVGP